jgi:hypothetical protein
VTKVSPILIHPSIQCPYIITLLVRSSLKTNKLSHTKRGGGIKNVFQFYFFYQLLSVSQVAKFDYSVYQKCATMNEPYRISYLRGEKEVCLVGGLRGNRTEVRENVIKLDLSRL